MVCVSCCVFFNCVMVLWVFICVLVMLVLVIGCVVEEISKFFVLCIMF